MHDAHRGVPAPGSERHSQVGLALPTGVATRPVDPARDLEPIALLVNEMRRSVGDPLLDSPADIHDIVAGTEVNTASDTLLVESRDRVILGYAVAYPVIDSTKPRVFLMGATHPRYRGRGIGRALLHWSIDRAAELLSDHPKGTIQAQCGEGELLTQRLYQAAGLRPIRWFADLRLTLTDGEMGFRPDNRSLAPGYRVVRFDEFDPEALRLLHNACFADHWGSSPMTHRYWHEEFLKHESLRPGQSEIVIDRDNSGVAYQLTNEFPQDQATTGRVRWIGSLGVHPAHRRRGLATGLIARHVDSARHDGFDASMISVDTDSLTGANRLYERIGYRRQYGGIRYILGGAEFA